MVKIVKKKKKLRIEGIISLVFIMALLTYVASTTLLRSHNVGLAKTEETLEREITILKNDVSNLELQVKQLANRDRIIEIAEKYDLTINQEQIVSVQTNNE